MFQSVFVKKSIYLLSLTVQRHIGRHKTLNVNRIVYYDNQIENIITYVNNIITNDPIFYDIQALIKGGGTTGLGSLPFFLYTETVLDNI